MRAMLGIGAATPVSKENHVDATVAMSVDGQGIQSGSRLDAATAILGRAPRFPSYFSKR
jgi:hypothetical protein